MKKNYIATIVAYHPPSAYTEDMDYDGIDNQGEFPPKKNQINKMKNFIKKIQIWRIIRNLGKSKNKIL